MTKNKTVSDLSQLESMFAIALKDTINNEVFDVIRDELIMEMERRVYDVYQPKRYERRGSSGGLKDPDNFVISMPYISDKKMSFLIENVTKGNGENLDEFINELIEGIDGFAGNPSTGMPARPYTEYAYSNLISSASRNDMLEALYKGLRKRGFNVSVK
ncbi:hypothetical protein AB2L37_00845 [Staphylococcus pseudintermedius]|uniref:hypothetical protein n=1 Tax=Staphylococcus pseudintermedius TaxID=283734 RepID=UPI003F9AFBFB